MAALLLGNKIKTTDSDIELLVPRAHVSSLSLETGFPYPEVDDDYEKLLPTNSLSPGPKTLRQSILGWLPEILACALSLLCVTAIVATLLVYDGQLTPNWPLGITLNSLLALLTSLAKIALLAPVVQGIGQLRWQWFSQRYQRLTDFDLFEEASRSTWGSFKLLVSLKGGIFTALGAFLVVTSFLTSPITQQAIQYPTKLVPTDAQASVSRVTLYNYPIPFSQNSGLDMSIFASSFAGFKKNMLSGAYSTDGTPLEDSPPVCSSGDCTFPDFVSLGFCTKVADVSDRLTVKQADDRDWNLFGLEDNSTWTASLPVSSAVLTIPNLRSLDFFADLTGGSLSFLDAPESNTSSLNVYLIYSNPPATPGGHVTFGAFEILFYWCSKAFSLNVTATTAHWTELGRSTSIKESNLSTLNIFKNARFIECMLGIGVNCDNTSTWGRMALAPPRGFESHRNIVIEERTGVAIAAALELSFMPSPLPPPRPETNESFVNSHDGGIVLIGKGMYRMNGDMSLALGTALWGLAPPGHPLLPSAQLDAAGFVFGNMAKGLENFLRQSAHMYEGNSASVNGTALSPTPYVEIEWPWLVFLMAELLLSVVFLVGTLMLTHSAANMQTIKGSSLATLCSLDESSRQALGGMHSLAHLQERARRAEVKLERNDDGGLWLVSRKA
ncbi:hypothetical protein B0H63DRAFT_468510 [Podospora didyma]|uniref:Uncharacterized protein n=1 Tax=Podospora didyma TaxID=330526 RepID=A0AAE0NSF7_9PEZI|nr:hypothetical protein B0H63DRAFT_468510 [Podospora didyma]